MQNAAALQPWPSQVSQCTDQLADSIASTTNILNLDALAVIYFSRIFCQWLNAWYVFWAYWDCLSLLSSHIFSAVSVYCLKFEPNVPLRRDVQSKNIFTHSNGIAHNTSSLTPPSYLPLSCSAQCKFDLHIFVAQFYTFEYRKDWGTPVHDWTIYIRFFLDKDL